MKKAPKTTYRMKEGADRSTMMASARHIRNCRTGGGLEFVKGALSQR